jgi:serine phosphatase RsbU (regulator of sigma subunit)
VHRRPVRWLAFLLLLLAAGLTGRGAEPERAWFGDGENYLVVPTQAFQSAPEITVEGWIRWDGFGRYSRFYDVGRAFHSIAVTHYETSPNLLFEAWNGASNHLGLHISGLLRSNEWTHLATTVGPGGMRLHVNGLLVASNAVPQGFHLLDRRIEARFGRGNWDRRNDSLQGALSELRVWQGARTPVELQSGLFRRARSDEPGLAALWPLDGSLTEVLSGKPARAWATARFVRRELPAPDQLPHPAILSGQLRNAEGQPVNLAHLRIRTRDGRILAAGRTGTDGNPTTPDLAGPGQFRVAIYETNEPIRIELIHPAGRVSAPPMSLRAGEWRTLNLSLPNRPATADTTNQFVRLLMADLGLGEPWLREMAAHDLTALGPFPQAAAALAGSLPFERDPRVRERIALSLHELADRSPVAIAALLEDTEAIPWLKTDELQSQIRQRPVPQVLQPIYTRRTLAAALLFSGIFGSFALLHFFFFLCERGNRTDGIYALFTGTGAAGTLVTEWARGSTDPWKMYLGPALLGLAYLHGLLMVYSLFSTRLPRRFWVLSSLGIVVGLRILFPSKAGGDSTVLQVLVLFVAFAIVLEMLRVLWQAYRAGKPGARLIGGGVVFFFVCQFLAPLETPILFDDVRSAWLFPLGMSAFVASASLHLARQFVRTNRALREANLAIAQSQGQLHREIAEAEAYLRSLLPARLEGPPVTTRWIFQPSSMLGGDAFGYHWIDEHRFAIYLIDACGHGVGAALLSVSALNTLRSPQLSGARFADPVAVLAELNHAFPMEAHHHQYFSAWYGIFDRRDRSLRYASAGHPPAYLLAAGQSPAPLRTPGAPIGCRRDAVYLSERVEVPVGASLLVISDGAYEVVRPDGRPCSLKDFESELARHRWNSPEDLLEWARQGNGGRPLEDDVSVVQVTFD